MALALPDDVRRYMNGLTATDAEIQPYLDAASEWVKRACHRDWDATGTVTESFYNVKPGDILYLKDEEPTAVTVKVFISPASESSTLSVGAFQVLSRGRVQLRKLAGALRPEEREYVIAPVYARVDVTYTRSGVVPVPVREAVAMIAASAFINRSLNAPPLRSEDLGDYRYTIVDDETWKQLIPPRALSYLRPYAGYRRAVSV